MASDLTSRGGINSSIHLHSQKKRFTRWNSVLVPVEKQNRERKNKEEKQEEGSAAAVPLDRLGQLLVPTLHVVCSFHCLRQCIWYYLDTYLVKILDGSSKDIVDKFLEMTE